MTRAVEDVLEEIHAADSPRVLVLNKADALDEERRAELAFRHPDAVLVSAVTGEGLDDLRERIAAEFERTLRRRRAARALLARAARLSDLHDVAGDLSRTDTADGVLVTARLPTVLAERYDRYAVNGDDGAAPSGLRSRSRPRRGRRALGGSSSTVRTSGVRHGHEQQLGDPVAGRALVAAPAPRFTSTTLTSPR